MRLFVIKTIRLKRGGKLFDVSPGAIVEIEKPEKAQALIESGYVRPLLPDDIVKPFAFRLYLKILDVEIWVVTHPDAAAFVPDNAVIYLPEEIQNLRGASEDEIRQIHIIKKELGGKLIAVKDRNG